MILKALRGLYQFPLPRSDQKELITSAILLVFINFHLGERCSRLAQQGCANNGAGGHGGIPTAKGFSTYASKSLFFQEPLRLLLRTKV
jgi:hypothetical protein